MDDEYEKLFIEGDASRNTPRPQTVAEKVVTEAEQEFRSYSAEEHSRQSEEEEIKEQMKILRKKFSQYKNVKNSRLRHINDERAKKRKEIMLEIEKYKLRLREIHEERGVVDISSQHLIIASSKKTIADDGE